MIEKKQFFRKFIRRNLNKRNIYKLLFKIILSWSGFKNVNNSRN